MAAFAYSDDILSLQFIGDILKILLSSCYDRGPVFSMAPSRGGNLRSQNSNCDHKETIDNECLWPNPMR
jgi:hypothetical protein